MPYSNLPNRPTPPGERRVARYLKASPVNAVSRLTDPGFRSTSDAFMKIVSLASDIGLYGVAQVSHPSDTHHSAVRRSTFPGKRTGGIVTQDELENRLHLAENIVRDFFSPDLDVNPYEGERHFAFGSIAHFGPIKTGQKVAGIPTGTLGYKVRAADEGVTGAAISVISPEYYPSWKFSLMVGHDISELERRENRALAPVQAVRDSRGPGAGIGWLIGR